ncbi:MAG: tannase [Clostridia bacterium]|nr:tannase [Clostridia bacterium]
MKTLLTVLLTAILAVSLATGASASEDSRLSRIDMTKWQYEPADDVYWQVGLSYAATPADSSYETMGFFIPGAYFDALDNGDGTYTCSINESGTAGNYTAKNAPWIIPVNTPGYSAMNAPSGYTSSMGYGSISDYTGAGMVVLFAGARGRDAGAPAGVTDFKAAIRYARYNAALLPGDSSSVFSLGMSGGGAQSALLGATGNSALYDSYLEAIGAVMTESDAVKGSMCWCPITNLDIADEAYEWNMGNTRSGLSTENQAYSDGMALAFAEYINQLGLTDGDGNPLLLTESSEGIFQSGSYYEYVKHVIETSLEHFMSDTEFPYTASSSGGFGGRMGGRGGMGGGRFGGGAPDGNTGDFTFPDEGKMPDFANGELPGNGSVPDKAQAENTNYEEMDGIARAETASSALSLSGTYETKQDYIDALNANGEWVSWDEDSNTVSITSIAAFTKALKNASKSIAAFDQLDAGQGENTLFGYGDGSGAHFDPILASLAAGSEYESAFSTDLAREDALGNTVGVRVNMYNPMYYLSPAYAGYKTSEPAAFWRIRTGINQGDTALCTEIDLALAAAAYSDETSVDFETVWAQGHTEAERTGSSTQNFIAWVNACMQ